MPGTFLRRSLAAMLGRRLDDDEYLATQRELALRSSRVMLGYVGVAYPAFYALDLIVYGKWWLPFGCIRLVHATLALGALAAAPAVAPETLRRVAQASAISATSSVALMCAWTEGFNSLYVVGMIICFLAISTLEIFRPAALLGWLLAMTVGYVALNAGVAPTLDLPHAVASTSFVLGAVLFCGVSALLTDQHRYNLFLVHRELLLRNSELQRAREQQAHFLSTVSHELRSPVNSMMGFCELVEMQERELRPKSRANLVRVRESGQRLLGLINDLLDLSKAESGLMQVHPTTFELMTVVREVAEATRALVLHRALDVRVEGPESLMVQSDELRLRQVLINLASNAAKFTEHGHVTLSVSTEHGVTLTVTDTGPGIPIEARTLIFEAFRQLGVGSGGTGLGLAIVKHLVELLQGRIELESELGRGSTFRVHLGAIEARVAA